MLGQNMDTDIDKDMDAWFEAGDPKLAALKRLTLAKEAMQREQTERRQQAEAELNKASQQAGEKEAARLRARAKLSETLARLDRMDQKKSVPAANTADKPAPVAASEEEEPYEEIEIIDESKAA